LQILSRAYIFSAKSLDKELDDDMSKQRAHWAITIKEDTYLTWSPRQREKFDSFVGKYAKCQGQRMKLAYDNNQHYWLAVGLKEREDDRTSATHWHCLFSCLPGKTCTRGRVSTVMGMNYMTIPGEYCQALDTNPQAFMKYAHKTSDDERQRHDVDGIIRDTFDMLKKKSVVSKETFNAYLCEKYGASWTTKNKTIIDTFCSIQEQCYAERIVVAEEDDKDIEERTREIIASFHDNVLKQIGGRNAQLQTKCEALQNVETEDIAKYITFVALLPYMFQRARNVIDFIPGLYFWGDAQAGKSFIFQLGKSYRTIATDSVGVGKFKLETCESAFLLDDVRGDAVDTGSYISTLRQLTLGAYTRVKVHSETRQVKGFVAVTSNEKPVFLNSDYDEKNRNAWLRRFIVVEFTRDLNMDEILVNGNEFEYKASQNVIAPFMKNIAQHLRKKYGQTHRVYKSIHVYKRHLDKYIQAMPIVLEDSEQQAPEQDGTRPNLDSSVGHFDKPQIITAANLIVPHRHRISSPIIVSDDSSTTTRAEVAANKRLRIVDYADESDSDGFDISNGKRVKLVKANSRHFMR
jgi:hypothetical protein